VRYDGVCGDEAVCDARLTDRTGVRGMSIDFAGVVMEETVAGKREQ
jgi:hypothetical protein